MKRLFYLRVKVWFEEKRNAVALASQLVDDSVYRRPQVVVGPGSHAQRVGGQQQGALTVNMLAIVTAPFQMTTQVLADR